MKHFRLFTLAAILIIAAMVLTACPSGQTGDQPAATTEQAAVQEPTAAPEPTATPMPEPTAAPEPEPTAAMEEPTEAPAEGEMMAEGIASFGVESCDGFDGTIQKVIALDEMTVEFKLCKPDPAFLSKVAFSSFAIQPSEWIESAAASGELLEKPVGTGPYMLDSWNRGDSIVYKKNADYWGDPAMTDTLVFRWLTEGAGRLLELQSGTVDGIDNPSPDDFDTIRDDANLQLLERPALNIFYLAMTDTFEPWGDVRVRQAIAKGIDRQRIVDTFYPAGSEVASHFTPCSIPNGCVGDDWYDFNVEEAKALLADAGYADGFETTIYYRDVFRSYLPEPGLVAQDIQAQLKENLNIDASIEVMESGAFIAESSAGNLDGLYLLGWGADYPHITNFLDYHFGRANPQFGDPHPEIYELLEQGAQIADAAAAEAIYTDANNAIRELVPMVPIAHGGSGVAYLADVEGAQASPLGNEYMAAMKPGDRDTFVWMQNAEPISLYCGDETDGESLRACEQVTESLYAYEIGGTAAEPALATSCEPNEDLTMWTCTLRDGVTFHDGSSLDAMDVLASWQAGLDASSPTHVGNTGAFEYFSYLWGLMNVQE
ncbi:MAG: ABC transporter substrate-binding protein [Caldilineales bacterium]